MYEDSYTPMYNGDGDYALLGLTREEAWMLMAYMDGCERGTRSAMVAQDEMTVSDSEGEDD